MKWTPSNKRRWKKNKERTAQTNKKAFRNQNRQQKSHQRIIPLVRYSKIYKKTDQRIRKLMTMHKALHLIDDIDRLYGSRKEGGRRLASIKDSVDTSIRQLIEYIKKSQERLITTTWNCTGQIIRTTMISKQKWKEKQLYGFFQTTNWRNLTREDLDMAKKGKPFERNWNSSNSSFLERSRYLSLFLLYFSFTLWSAETAKSSIQQILFLFVDCH